MSEIVEWLSPPEVCAGDPMPWGALIIEGDRFLITAGLTGRDPDKPQEYPAMLEDDSFESIDQASLNVAPHGIEEQTRLVLEKNERVLEEANTSFENVFYSAFYVTERHNWPTAFRTVRDFMRDNGYDDYLDKPRPNVMSVVDGLDHPDMLIEIMMWATVPE